MTKETLLNRLRECEQLLERVLAWQAHQNAIRFDRHSTDMIVTPIKFYLYWSRLDDGDSILSNEDSKRCSECHREF